MRFLTNQGFLQRVSDLLHTQLPSYTSAHLQYRGTSLPLDTLLSGTLRFGYRIGSVAALMFTDTWTILTEDVQQNASILPVESLPSWVDSGVLVAIGKQSLHKILSVDRDTNEITIDDDVNATFLENTALIYYAFPIAANGAFPLPGNLRHITVTTQHKIFIGDVLGIEAFDGNINSLGEYTVLAALDVTVGPGPPYTFDLDLDTDIARTVADEDTLYLLCNLGYESQQILLPVNPGSYYQIVGPFLVDWFSGELLDNVYADEVYSLETYNSASVPIEAVRTVEKNHVVADAPLAGSVPLFWTCSRGSLQYSPEVTHLISDRVPLVEAFSLTQQVFDPHGVITGTPETYYVELKYLPLEIETVKIQDTEMDYTELAGTKRVWFPINSVDYAQSETTIASGSIYNDDYLIETTQDHGLVTGDTIEIVGHGGTPDVNGERTVTVLTPRKFTLPVTVTLPGAGGTLWTPDWVHVRTSLVHGLQAGDTATIEDNSQIADGDYKATVVGGRYSFRISAPSFSGASAGGIVKNNMEVVVTYVHNSDDVYGKAFLWTELVPAWEPNHEWLMSLLANSDGLFRLRFYPNDWQDVQLLAGVPASWPVSICPLTAILTSSAANPTIITTAAPHGYVTGDQVVVEKHLGSTPSVDGEHAVTVIDATHFSVPVNVTIAGFGGRVRKVGEAATRIELVWRGDERDSTVQLGDWATLGSRVRSLKYTVVARFTGGYQWATSGILVKPIFLNMDTLKARLDRDSFNKGAVIL